MHKIFFVAIALMASAASAGNPEDANAKILKFESKLEPSGSYNYEFETSNQIKAEENGVGSTFATGSYSYVAPNGETIRLQYTADEHGFQPKGDHLPTPPPIPPYILKALRYIESHPFRVSH